MIKDISDWIAAGGTAGQLKVLIDDAPIYAPLYYLRFWDKRYKAYTVKQLIEELEWLETAPIKHSPKLSLIEWQLVFCKKALEYKSHRNEYLKALME